MKYILNKSNILIILSALIVFGGIWAVYEFNFARDSEASVGYRVNASQSVHVNEWGTCREVNNSSSGPPTFVPTNTSGEWTAFRNNKPVNISLTTCSSGGGGSGGGSCGVHWAVCDDTTPCCSGLFCFFWTVGVEDGNCLPL